MIVPLDTFNHNITFLSLTFFDAYFFCTLSSFADILDIRKTFTLSVNVLLFGIRREDDELPFQINSGKRLYFDTYA